MFCLFALLVLFTGLNEGEKKPELFYIACELCFKPLIKKKNASPPTSAGSRESISYSDIIVISAVQCSSNWQKASQMRWIEAFKSF